MKRSQLPAEGMEFHPAAPLWQRVPSRDVDGVRLSDFMMLIPNLRRQPTAVRQRTIGAIQDVLDAYGKAVVFADLNLRLNLLWVSVRPIPGICLELSCAIKLRVPEALLVAHKTDA